LQLINLDDNDMLYHVLILKFEQIEDQRICVYMKYVHDQNMGQLYSYTIVLLKSRYASSDQSSKKCASN